VPSWLEENLAAVDVELDEDDLTTLKGVEEVGNPSGDRGRRRRISNSGGYVVKRVAAHAYDWLSVLRPEGSESHLRECHAGRRAITPRAEHGIGAVAEPGLLQLP